MLSSKDTVKAIKIMSEKFPDARTSLEADTDFHFLLAVILSAQTTDKAVNLLTPRLFAAYPTPETLAAAKLEDVIPFIKSIGLYRNKGKYLIACATDIAAKFNGQVPRTRTELMQLSGVGRKTADVVLAECFNIPAIAVDTHVTRVSKRLRIVPQKADVLTIEKTLMKKLPEELWIKAHHCMIFWGRYQCMARSPLCQECPLLALCAEGQKRVM
ncbi:endonuclease III [Liquorilactobacillus sucicola DSM 21376 = JCM 15457]|uniref:Endonuclease III n=1 Tax=Liquorilactobacillus sucicola DSM 21376 = JCM 15457 TaxID=1423806 RepID=A0A023CW94_9LACO|nr:endonuclease III [Liquorilactobacillus sucicola]KRN06202.1 endonuclease III [Liquorilactobacillus sucicola DSM 21376 = JCM 15457]GAJ26132.1 endonuclease III [Liquorilactobacillus sucicola DSM 21376 = JCM 15457]